MIRPTRNGLPPIRPAASRAGHLAVGFARPSVSARSAEGADRRPQLVADVGDEVAPNGLEAAALGDVVDDRNRADKVVAVRDRPAGEHERAGRRTMQLERPRLVIATAAASSNSSTARATSRVGMPSADQGDRVVVAKHRRALGIADDHALREHVEGAAQSLASAAATSAWRNARAASCSMSSSRRRWSVFSRAIGEW